MSVWQNFPIYGWSFKQSRESIFDNSSAHPKAAARSMMLDIDWVRRMAEEWIDTHSLSIINQCRLFHLLSQFHRLCPFFATFGMLEESKGLAPFSNCIMTCTALIALRSSTLCATQSTRSDDVWRALNSCCQRSCSSRGYTTLSRRVFPVQQ